MYTAIIAMPVIVVIGAVESALKPPRPLRLFASNPYAFCLHAPLHPAKKASEVVVETGVTDTSTCRNVVLKKATCFIVETGVV